MIDQNFEDEQEEIVGRITAIKKEKPKLPGRKGKWNKYFGDVANRIVIHYLAKYMPASHSIMGPAVYIEDIGNEFDALVVDRNAEPIEFSNAYPRQSVRLAIEVKERGFFYKKAEAEWHIRKARESVLENLGGIPFVYITLHESETIMLATRRVYGDDAFFLSTGTGSRLEILPQEWKRFVETVQRIVR